MRNPEEYDANFDLNDDGWITVTDELIVRNIHTVSYDQYTKAYEKLMAAVQERMWLHSGDEGFEIAFDTDLDGDIDTLDSKRVSGVLIRLELEPIQEITIREDVIIGWDIAIEPEIANEPVEYSDGIYESGIYMEEDDIETEIGQK